MGWLSLLELTMSSFFNFIKVIRSKCLTVLMPEFLADEVKMALFSMHTTNKSTSHDGLNQTFY